MHKFIVIEGIDGSGKTTIAKKLANDFGYTYMYSVANELAIIRKEIDLYNDPVVRFFYYITSLIALQSKLISYLKLTNVVMDRYIDSTKLYHFALGVPEQLININNLPLKKPDCVFVLNVDKHERIRRISSRAGDTFQDSISDIITDVIEDKFLDRARLTYPDNTYIIENKFIDSTVNNILSVISTTVKY